MEHHPGGEGARYELSLADPLNSRKCQRIACDAGRAGVQQAGIPVEPGVEYTGSLWIRGQALSVRVELLGCGVPPVAAGGGSDAWREVPLRFRPTVRADGTVLRITVEGPCDLCVDQVTLRRADTPWRPAIHSQLKALQPAFIRWPGGCYAEWYRWKDGVGPLHRRTTAPNFMWGGLDPNHFGTDEFLRLCHELGAEPVMVLNIGKHMPSESRADYIAEALEWIEYCNGDTTTPMGARRAANGHPEPHGVKYWESATRPGGWGGEVRGVPHGVLAVDPRASPGPCPARMRHRRLLPEMERGNPRRCRAALRLPEASMCTPTGLPEEEFAEGWRKYPEFLDETAALIARSANPGMKIAVTEWNEQSTWLRGGIYAGLLLNEMERRSDVVAMACPALLIRNVDAPAWDNAFINHDGVHAFAAPNALVAGLYRANFCRERVKVSCPDELNVLAVRESVDGDVVVRIVNPSGAAVETRFVLDGNPVDLRPHLAACR